MSLHEQDLEVGDPNRCSLYEGKRDIHSTEAIVERLTPTIAPGGVLALSAPTVENRTFDSKRQALIANAEQSGAPVPIQKRTDKRKARQSWQKLMKELEKDPGCPWSGFVPGDTCWISSPAIWGMLGRFMGREYQPFRASDIVDQSVPHLLNFRGRARTDHRLDKDGKVTPVKRFPLCVPHCCFRWTEGSKVGPHTVAQCPLLKRLSVDSLMA